MWLLIDKYKIPTIFITKTTTKSTKTLTNNKSRAFVAYGEKEDKFAFIMVPGLKAEQIPGFKFIETDNGDVFFSLNNLQESNGTNEINKAFENKKSINKYLEDFKKPASNPHTKRKVIIQDEEDEEDESERNEKKDTEEEYVIVKKNPILEGTKKNRVVINKQRKTKKNVKGNVEIVSEE